MSAAVVVGVDTGGTFTDFVIRDADGRLTVRKLSSTPHDPSQSVLAGIREAQADGLLSEGYDVVHGTTVATNALLQRRGAATALITTAGFRDVLAIGRQARTDLYAFAPAKPPVLLPREHCFELAERLDWRGQIVTPLSEADTLTLLDTLKAQGIQSLAICFLFSYLNPVHERMVGRLARERGFAVSLSSDIAPEPREYERAATTAANAFVAPLMESYLTNLQTQTVLLHAAHLRVMQSNGGALSAREAARRAITTALSGPAGGIVAAAYVGERAGFTDLLTFDMGGTSTDVALIAGGQCPVVTNGSLGGLPLRTPQLDIHTVGAGGGSLARLDSAGGLRVGPQSAGADPGPVAYGRGETLTVTDANVYLGRLPADVRLGGRVPLDAERVHARFIDFARSLNRTPEQAALGVLTVVDVAMTRALRHVSVERGHDPARFTLLSFGGAGGLHACALADALQMPTILIPRFPGAFSALGLTLAQTRREYAHALPPTRLPLVQADVAGQEKTAPSNLRDTAPDFDLSEAGQTNTARLLDSLSASFNASLNELRGQAGVDMAAEGIGAGQWQEEALLDMRYVGQSFELRVPVQRTSAQGDAVRQNVSAQSDEAQNSDVQNKAAVPNDTPPASAAITPTLLEQAVRAFHTLHTQRFGYANVHEPVEITGIRLLATGDTDAQVGHTVILPGQKATSADGQEVPSEPDIPAVSDSIRRVYIADNWRDVPMYSRTALRPGQIFDGPALVIQEDATAYIAPNWRVGVDTDTNLVLRRSTANIGAAS